MCTEKLVLDYHFKKEYVIHYLTLQCYLQLGGFKIENIHYIIKFNQNHYMKDYIQLNHKYRCKSNDKNDEKMFKLMNCLPLGSMLLS